MTKMNFERRNLLDKLSRKRPENYFLKVKKKSRKRHVDMQSKFDSKCDTCQDKIIKGKWIKWYPDIKTVLHKHCKLSEEKKRELNMLDPNRPPSKPPKR